MNKAIVCGRITSEPDIRMTSTGKKVCKFTLAVDDGKNADGSRRTQFIDCDAWNQSAEFLERYVKKGNRILVEGRLNKTSYEKDGQKHYPTTVVCDRVEFADGANQPQNEQTSVVKQNAPKTAQNQYYQAQPYQPSPEVEMAAQYGLDISADDLPF